MSNLAVNYRGVVLAIEGEYYKGEERAFDYPGSGHEFEIEQYLRWVKYRYIRYTRDVADI